MQLYDPRTDAYITKAADFALPILSHIREVVHRASPRIGETIKLGGMCTLIIRPGLPHRGL